MCLADALSRIDAGRYTPDGSLDGITVTCWNNTAEFADKTAQEYESLPKASQVDVGNDIVPNYMDHAYYSPQTGINRLLRPYFPEQPGDTPLIDSPVGRFISTVTEMWLHGSGRKLHIKKHHNTEISDCLLSGMLSGDCKAYAYAYNKVYPYVEDAASVEEIIEKLQKLQKLKNLEEINDRTDDNETIGRKVIVNYSEYIKDKDRRDREFNR